MNKQKLSLFFCFVLILFSSNVIKADVLNQNPENVSKSSSIGLYSKKNSAVTQKDDNNSNVRFRAIGGGGGPIEGFEDTGANENENAYVDPSPSPLGSFPCVFLLCLAIGYGIYKKKRFVLFLSRIG